MFIVQGREVFDRRYGNASSRVYGKNGGIKCANCKQKYHTARNCPWPKVRSGHYYVKGVEVAKFEIVLQFTTCLYLSSLPLSLSVSLSLSPSPPSRRHQVCYLCGGADHICSQCPNDLCTYCYQEKHRGRSCSAPWSSPRTQCLRCFMTGHHASVSWSCDCHDLLN